jgi:hypothetical protein
MAKSREAQAVIDALYTRQQKELDVMGDSNEDICRAFKLASIIINAESGTPLEMLNKMLAKNGITEPLEVYVEQKEDEVDIVTDEGVTTVSIDELELPNGDQEQSGNNEAVG